MTRITIVLAGLMGAAGVVLAAMGAHAATTGRLTAASSMLLFHASVVICAVVVAERRMAHPAVARIAAIGFIVGAALFAGDLTLRDLAGHSLFTMAAPTGGTILI